MVEALYFMAFNRSWSFKRRVCAIVDFTTSVDNIERLLIMVGPSECRDGVEENKILVLTGDSSICTYTYAAAHCGPSLVDGR